MKRRPSDIPSQAGTRTPPVLSKAYAELSIRCEREVARACLR